MSKQGGENDALTVFESVLKISPDNVEARIELAKARARGMEFAAAFADLNKALTLKIKPKTAVNLGKLKGRWLARSGKFEEAITTWKDLVAKHPDDELALPLDKTNQTKRRIALLHLRYSKLYAQSSGNYQAYQYRQSLRNRRVRYNQSISPSAGNSFITFPKKLSQLHSYALHQGRIMATKTHI